MKRVSVTEQKFKEKFESYLKVSDKQYVHDRLDEYMQVAFKMNEMGFISDRILNEICLMYLHYYKR